MGSLYPDDVIREAEKWIGYHEEGDNWTIFAQALDAIHYFNGNKQNVAWCGTYTYYCILKACIPEDRSDEEKKWDALYFTYQPTKDNCACGCRYGADYFRQNDAFYPVSEAKKGDVIFFGARGAETHQGLVRYVDNGRVYTIEGNKSDSVQLCDYSLSYSRISGVGRPRYDGDDKPEPQPEPPKPTPTPEPTPTGDKHDDDFKGTWAVTAPSGLWMRTGAGTDNSKIMCMSYGSICTSNGDTEDVDGTMWLKVSQYGKTGWSSSDWLRKL